MKRKHAPTIYPGQIVEIAIYRPVGSDKASHEMTITAFSRASLVTIAMSYCRAGEDIEIIPLLGHGSK